MSASTLADGVSPDIALDAAIREEDVDRVGSLSGRRNELSKLKKSIERALLRRDVEEFRALARREAGLYGEDSAI